MIFGHFTIPLNGFFLLFMYFFLFNRAHLDIEILHYINGYSMKHFFSAWVYLIALSCNDHIYFEMKQAKQDKKLKLMSH